MAIKGAIPVEFGAVFPVGAFALGVEPVADFEASKGGVKVQARDKATGLPLWSVSVIDPDPEARDNATRVKVPAEVQPVLPDLAPGMPFRPVEFEGLTVTAWVNNSGRVAYSLKATGVRAPGGGSGKAARPAA